MKYRKVNSGELVKMIEKGNYPYLKSCSAKCDSSRYTLERLGTEYGGWVVPVNKIKENSTCYCVGAGEDISFDVQLISRFGCNVFTFDPTPRAKKHFDYFRDYTLKGEKVEVNPPAKRKIKDFYPVLRKDQFDKLKFFSYGIWSESAIKKFYVPEDPRHVSHSIINIQHTEEYFEARCITIKEAMQQLGHSELGILKVDIEGAEYEVIDTILRDNIRIKIFCVEFDRLCRPQDDHFVERAEKYVGNLVEAGFTPLFRFKNNFTFINERGC